MSHANPQISFVIINFNTAGLLRTCIHSIYEHCAVSAQIIVVDNDSQDNSTDMLRTEFQQVELIANETNLGFPKAVNQGLRAASAAYIFILNSDVHLTDRAVERLLFHLEENPGVGIAAPAQFTPGGEALLSVYLHPSLRREWARNLFFTDFIRYRLRGKTIAAGFKQAGPVEWVMGAALLARRAMLEQVGDMDENVFMYGEEFDWQYRAQKMGWQVYFVPEAKVIHEKGASATAAFNTRRYAIVTRSNLYFLAKHFGLLRLPFYVLAQLAGSGLRLLLAGPACLLGSKSACCQWKEHLAVVQVCLSPRVYGWIICSLDAGQIS